MPIFTDETLMAYVDGELPPDEARAVADALRTDAALAARLAPFADSRRILREAFAEQLAAPVPQHLLDAIAGGARVSHVPARRRVPRWAPTALAAALALGVGLTAGVSLRPGARGPALHLGAESALLARALETLPSGTPLAHTAGAILPLATLRTESGVFCREYETETADARARGIACRGADGRWQTEALVRLDDATAASEPDAFRLAAGGALDLARAVGPAARLTPAEEAARLHARWQD